MRFSESGSTMNRKPAHSTRNLALALAAVALWLTGLGAWATHAGPATPSAAPATRGTPVADTPVLAPGHGHFAASGGLVADCEPGVWDGDVHTDAA
jgi:hypothetical protein